MKALKSLERAWRCSSKSLAMATMLNLSPALCEGLTLAPGLSQSLWLHTLTYFGGVSVKRNENTRILLLCCDCRDLKT